MSNSGLTAYEDELLTILMEECGETTQEICKILRFGYNSDSHHVVDKTHRECLIQEMGDLLAMIELIYNSDIGISVMDLAQAKRRKLDKIEKWMNHKKS